MKNLTVFLFFLLAVNNSSHDTLTSKICPIYEQVISKEQKMRCKMDSINAMLDSLDYKFMLIEQYLMNQADTLR